MKLNPESFPDGPAAPQQLAQHDELQSVMSAERRSHIFLLGFYAEHEVQQLLQGKNLQPDHFDMLMRLWEGARDRVHTLPPVSTEPEVAPILEPEALLEIAKLTGRPDFKQVFPDGTWRVSLVEFSGIVPFQPNVDVEYALRQGPEVLKPSDVLSAVKLCFPLDKPTALAVNVDQAQKAITVSGINPALQVVGIQCGQQAPQGLFVISLQLGIGPNIVQVSRYRGRYFLTNGYHRAFRLLKEGFTHLPCLLKDVNNFAETGAMAPGFFSESILMSARPPLYTDFKDDALGIAVPVHTMRKVVRIRPDEYFMPG